MNISKINELLTENIKIKRKIGEIKRKLNLKCYNLVQKQELNKIISKLEGVYFHNQEECCRQSVMKAGTVAHLVCKVLNREYGCHYNVATAVLNYPEDSAYTNMTKYFKGVAKGTFLVVANRKIRKDDVVSIDNIDIIPILYSSSFVNDNYPDEYTYYVLEQQEINLFESVDLNNVFAYEEKMKTFNFGVAGNKDKLSPEILKLRENVKKELGIVSNNMLETSKKQQ